MSDISKSFPNDYVHVYTNTIFHNYLSFLQGKGQNCMTEVIQIGVPLNDSAWKEMSKKIH
jgi:hypothetical protein